MWEQSPNKGLELDRQGRPLSPARSLHHLRVVEEGLLKAPLQIETSRLILAAPTADDAEAVFDRYASDPEVTKYLGWSRHESVADTRGFLSFSAAEWTAGRLGPV